MAYGVEWSAYSVRHFRKKFIKKYHSSWGHTAVSLEEELSRYPFPVLPQTPGVLVCDADGFIAKIEFAVFGTNQSKKSSGNRVIVHGDYETGTINILMVYSKSDIVGASETVWWKSVIRNEFPDDAGRYC